MDLVALLLEETLFYRGFSEDRAQPRNQVVLWFNTNSNFKTQSRTIYFMKLSHFLVSRLFSYQCILQSSFTNILIWHKHTP